MLQAIGTEAGYLCGTSRCKRRTGLPQEGPAPETGRGNAGLSSHCYSWCLSASPCSFCACTVHLSRRKLGPRGSSCESCAVYWLHKLQPSSVLGSQSQSLRQQWLCSVKSGLRVLMWPLWPPLWISTWLSGTGNGCELGRQTPK